MSAHLVAFNENVTFHVQLDFTYISTGILNSRGNTAASSFSSINRGSMSSMMVSAVRNTADRPEERQRGFKKLLREHTLILCKYKVVSMIEKKKLLVMNPLNQSNYHTTSSPRLE